MAFQCHGIRVGGPSLAFGEIFVFGLVVVIMFILAFAVLLVFVAVPAPSINNMINANSNLFSNNGRGRGCCRR